MSATRRILAWAGAISLTACGSAGTPDWRTAAFENAHRAIREEAGDPNAAFSAEQITGDEFSGQVCGRVTAHNDSLLSGTPARFVWFIDGNGGPWVEGGHGPHAISSDYFDRVWDASCKGEGYVEPKA